MMEISWASLGALLAHLLYALIGITVLLLAPRVAANRAFAVFAVGSGLAGVVVRLAEPMRIASAVAEPLEAGLWVVGAIGVLALVTVFPERLGPRDRGPARLAMGLGAILMMLLAASWIFDPWRRTHLAIQAFSVLMIASSVSAVLLAMRARRSSHHATPYAAMALAVFAPIGIATGAWLSPASGERYLMMAVFSGVCLGTVTVAWLSLTVRVRAWPWPIIVCWVALGAALAGQISSMYGGETLVAWESTIVVVRLVAVAPLVFLIIRGQLPGLETKVRWGVSRGTVAAAFVATFFVASEGAQIAFGQGNEWVGLFAAGALVFAIAPLQRAAERLAEKAVPVAQPVPPPQQPVEDRLIAYRLAVAAALREDALITPREETHLADLAQLLGVGAGDALRVRREIEADLTRTGRASP